MTEPLFQARGLSVRYRLRRDGFGAARFVDALADVDLDWYPGETLAVVGESGSGKSTLGRVLLNLIEPTGGAVRYRGIDLRQVPATRLRREAQLVFQDPYQSLNPRHTVGTQVLDGLEIHRVADTHAERTAIAIASLEAAGLAPAERYWTRYPHQLSGGQLQRVVIASALALSPEALVCDEPVASLDVSVRAQVLKLLDQLRREQNLAMLFITHDVSLARMMSTRIVVLYEGRVVETGETAAVLRDPQHEYTRRLLAAVPGKRLAG